MAGLEREGQAGEGRTASGSKKGNAGGHRSRLYLVQARL